ncbi:unnamed protein product [Closterium sp. NIES-65]|nr:unnamed protein product [Closterium sp. NIES-65]
MMVVLVVGASVDYASSCEPSSLPGFANSVDLSGNGLMLHWTLNASRLQFALEAKPASAAESGWFSVGWTANRGRMYPADCVVGNLPGSSVGAYHISGYSQSDVAPSDGFSIGTPELTAASNGGGTIMRFARSEGDGGAVPVSFTGTNSLIWAFSEGSMNVDFTCQTAPAAGTSISDDDDNDDDDNGGDDDDDDDDDDDGEEEEDENQSSGSTSAAAAASGSGSQACQPSTLPVYSCSVQLKGKEILKSPSQQSAPLLFSPPIHFTTPVSFILHWKTGANTVAMAAEVATSGWVAIGWSKSSKMYPADAAIGNLPPGTLANGAAVGAYHMSGYGLSDVALTSSFELTNTTTTTANGRTTITLEQPLSVESVPISSPSQWNRSQSAVPLSGIGPNQQSLSVESVPISSPSQWNRSQSAVPLSGIGPNQQPLSVESVPISSPSQWNRFERPLSVGAVPIDQQRRHQHALGSDRPVSVGAVPISSSGATSVLWAFSVFERPLSVGSVPFSSSGATSVLWAISWSKPDDPSPFPHLIHPSPPAHSFERPLSVGSVPISSSGATNMLFAFSRLASLLFNSAYFLSPRGFTSPHPQHNCSFERPLSVGVVPISSSGATSVLWAFSRSDSQQLDDHGPNDVLWAFSCSDSQQLDDHGPNDIGRTTGQMSEWHVLGRKGLAWPNQSVTGMGSQ